MTVLHNLVGGASEMGPLCVGEEFEVVLGGTAYRASARRAPPHISLGAGGVTDAVVFLHTNPLARYEENPPVREMPDKARNVSLGQRVTLGKATKVKPGCGAEVNGAAYLSTIAEGGRARAHQARSALSHRSHRVTRPLTPCMSGVMARRACALRWGACERWWLWIGVHGRHTQSKAIGGRAPPPPPASRCTPTRPLQLPAEVERGRPRTLDASEGSRAPQRCSQAPR